MPPFARCFLSENSKKCETKVLAVLRFEIAFEIDAFRFNLFSTLRERAFKQVSLIESWGFVLSFIQGRDATSITYDFPTYRFEYDFQG